MRVLELFQVRVGRTWGFRVWVPCIENPKVYLHPEPFSAADLVVACSEKNSEGAALRGPSTRIMPVDTSQHLPQHTHTHTHTPTSLLPSAQQFLKLDPCRVAVQFLQLFAVKSIWKIQDQNVEGLALGSKANKRQGFVAVNLEYRDYRDPTEKLALALQRGD